jgi:membrane-bound lytic murein transglycosylase MltF
VTSSAQACAVLLAAASLAGCGAHAPLPFLEDAEPAGPALIESNRAALNTRFVPDAVAMPVVEADENLERNDLVELVDAGVAPAAIANGHEAEIWAKILEHVTLRPRVAVEEAGAIAGAMRKESPPLMAAAHGLTGETSKSTAPFKAMDRADHALAPGQRKFAETIEFIRRHAAAYDFDPLLIAAQGYQESGLDQSKRSRMGAVGIMQVMPTTARNPNVAIPDIHIAERNVEAGVKYLRFVKDRYFSDSAISPRDRTLLSFAAYNAGPGNIAKARKRADEMGLDPNVRFGSVELAAAHMIGREPVAYVRNIVKNYLMTYRLLEERRAAPDE